MLIKKITTGYVIQTFDTELARFVKQEFVASDTVEWEDENGKPMGHIEGVCNSFEMVQPNAEDDRTVTIDFIQSFNPLHMNSDGTENKVLICKDVLSIFREYDKGLLEAKQWVDGHHLVEIKHSAVAKLMDFQLQFRVIG